MKFERLFGLLAIAILPTVLVFGGCNRTKKDETKKEETKTEAKTETKAETKTPPKTVKALSCMNQKVSSCEDFIAGFTQERAKLLCGATDGTVFRVGQACPTANRVGSCEESYNDNRKAIYRFYSPAWDVEKAKKECADDINLKNDLIGKFIEG